MFVKLGNLKDCKFSIGFNPWVCAFLVWYHIQWWDFSSGALGHEEYSFMAITPGYTLTRRGGIC